MKRASLRLRSAQSVGGRLGIALRWAREHFPAGVAEDAGVFLGSLVSGEGSKAIAERLGRRQGTVRDAIARGKVAVFTAWGNRELKENRLRELGMLLEPESGPGDFD